MPYGVEIESLGANTFDGEVRAYRAITSTSPSKIDKRLHLNLNKIEEHQEKKASTSQLSNPVLSQSSGPTHKLSALRSAFEIVDVR